MLLRLHFAVLVASVLAATMAPEARGLGAGGVKGNADSSRPSLSSDGRYVAFRSLATNLSPDDPDATSDVYLRDLHTGLTALVSRATGPAGAKGNGYSGGEVHVSDDGRYVAFESLSTNLSPDDSDSISDIYVRDLHAQTTILVSRGSGAAGPKGNGSSRAPAMSAGGRFIAFLSAATNLSPDDTDVEEDVYVRDLLTDTTVLVSRASGAAGAKGDLSSGQPEISADGQYVAFPSLATNLSAADLDTTQDVFVRDRETDTTTLVSRAAGPAGAAGNLDSAVPSISGDGQLVSFRSRATNLSADDPDSQYDVFVRDLQGDTTSLVSRASGPAGDKGDGASEGNAISADGTRVTFVSRATNLSLADSEVSEDIFVRDLQAETTTLVSRADGVAGANSNQYALAPSISTDGRYVVFDSVATNLSLDDLDFRFDIYVRDVDDSITSLESRATPTDLSGQVVVALESDPEDPEDFTFTAGGGIAPTTFVLDDDGRQAPGPSSFRGFPVTAGTYSLSETVPAGWDLMSATCSDGSPPSSIAVSAGETVTCTFTNRKRGRIVAVQDSTPTDPQDFNFSAGGGLSPSNFSLDDDGDDGNALSSSRSFDDLVPGSGYSLTSSTPAGWDLTSATCSDGSPPSNVDVAAGEIVTCTFARAKRGRIVVVKDAQPDDAQDFSFNAGGGLSPASFQLDDDSDSALDDTRVFDNVPPGAAYSVSETPPGTWNQESATCDDGSPPSNIAVSAGETVTCKFVNRRDTSGVGTIRIRKDSRPNDAQDFRFTMGGGVPLPGSSILFMKPADPHIYGMDEDGGAVTQVAPVVAGAPAVSHDGSKIAYISSKNLNRPDIYVMNADGSGDTRLTNTPEFESVPSFSPDGSQVVFSSSLDGDEEIYTVSTVSGPTPAPTKLTDNVHWDTFPTWSSMNEIAFVSDRTGDTGDIYKMDPLGGNETQLTNGGFYANLDWSPDGTKIASDNDICGAEEGGCAVLMSSIQILDVSSGEVEFLPFVRFRKDRDPDWSPDGTKIAFQSNRGPEGIWRMNADGLSPTFLADGYYPSWGPATGFLLDDDADGTLSHEQLISDVPEGSGYSVAESIPTGWTQRSASCDDGSPVTNIDLSSGETVTCTFVNHKPSFVTRAGDELRLDGAPYRFTGFNIYNANSTGTCGPAMASGSALDDALTAIGPGKTAMRAWFFQSLATSGGLRDWSAFDHTLDIARARGVKVVATLTNQWADCEPASGYKDETWYQTGYTATDPSGTTSYRNWVAEIVDRYKDDPAILAWQLVNEAEVKPSLVGGCSVNAAGILQSFASDVAGLVKSIDSNHLVSLGTIGGGQCGTQGTEYQTVHAIPELDLCEYHDYGQPLAPIPGDQWNGFEVRMQQCQAVGKPLFVGENGIRPSDVGGTFQARAAAFRAKLNAQFQAGVVGELAWAWMNQGSTLNDFDIGPGDPALASLELPSGRIVVTEQSTPEDPQDFTFTTGGGLSPATFSLDDDADPALAGTRSFDVVPGSGHSLSQAVPAGWELTSATCGDGSPVSNVDVSPNETVTCTFQNRDAVAPDTSITSGPSGTTSTTNASFEFTSTEPASSFECRVDGGAYAPCSSPAAYSVPTGAHSFAVRAVDAAGNADPTPATRDWTVADIASGSPGAGGTLTTGSTPTSSDPLETSVTTPNAGAVTITEEPSTATPPAGFGLAGWQATISAPAATAAQPLVLDFRIDASLLAATNCGGSPCNATTLTVFRNGTPVPACSGAPATASPDPCVSTREAIGGGDARVVVLTSSASVWTFGGRTGYPRPKAANAVKSSLVPAYEPCAAPNRTHGPPLAHSSCHPPAPASDRLTVGTPDANGAPPNFTGALRLAAIVGVPGPPDDSDLRVAVSITDVRCGTLGRRCGPANTAGGADYVGALRAEATVRVTDRQNGPSGTEVATTQDFPLAFDVACADTGSASQGSACNTNVTLNALVPGAVRDGKRAVMALDQLRVLDSGDDGLTDTEPNDPFVVQGVFVP